MSPMDAARFRELAGSFPTGVAVVTALHPDGRPAGMTASAIASVSLVPPLLLVCVWHESDFHAVIATADHFALNVLAEDQEHLSRLFASEAPDRFADVDWAPHPTGVPLLGDVAAYLVCARRAAHEGGDHTIFVGELLDGALLTASPLVHAHGTYRRLQ